MPKERANIKEILAANIKENRRKRGLTQEKLAEMADMSLHYLALLETASKFPSGDMLEKLAKALDIQTFELFNPLSTPEGAIYHLENAVVTNIQQLIKETIQESVEETLAEECKKLKKG
jgi:transcriptional regulator with XRE-family HTH domain